MVSETSVILPVNLSSDLSALATKRLVWTLLARLHCPSPSRDFRKWDIAYPDNGNGGDSGRDGGRDALTALEAGNDLRRTEPFATADGGGASFRAGASDYGRDRSGGGGDDSR